MSTSFAQVHSFFDKFKRRRNAHISDEIVRELLQLTENEATLKQFCNKNREDTDNLLLSLVTTLNLEDVALKKKTNIVLCVCQLAKSFPIRDSVTNALLELNEKFQENLDDILLGTREYGRQLGRMHEYMIVTFMRVSNYRFKTNELLDLLSEHKTVGLNMLLGIMKTDGYEDAVYMNCMDLLHGYTSPSLYFHSAKKIASYQIPEFSRLIDKLIDHTIHINLVDEIGNIIVTRFFKQSCVLPAVCHKCVQFFLDYLLNLYKFGTSRPATTIRQHLLVGTQIIQNLVIPMIGKCVSTFKAMLDPSNQLQDCTFSSSDGYKDPVLSNTLHNCMEVLIISSFRMSAENVMFLRFLNSFTHDLLHIGNRAFPLDHQLYALIYQLNCNLDSFNGEAELKQYRKDTPYECLPKALRFIVGNSIANLDSSIVLPNVLQTIEGLFHLLPVSNDVQTYHDIIDMLKNNKKPSKVDFTEVTKELNKQDYQLREQLAELQDVQQSFTELRLKEDEKKRREMSSLSDLPALNRVGGGFTVSKLSNPKLSKRSQPSDAVKNSTKAIPEKYLCEINGHLMKNPVKTPNGNIVEEATIREWMKMKNEKYELTALPALQKEILEWTIQQKFKEEKEEEQ